MGLDEVGPAAIINDFWQFTQLVKMSVVTESTHFGNIANLTQSALKTVTLFNNSSFDLTECDPPVLSNATDFDIDSDDCAATINNNDSCSILIRGTPQTVGFKETTLTVECSGRENFSARLTLNSI